MKAPIQGFIASNSRSITSPVTMISFVSVTATTLAVRGDSAKIAVSQNTSPGPSIRKETRSPSTFL